MTSEQSTSSFKDRLFVEVSAIIVFLITKCIYLTVRWVRNDYADPTRYNPEVPSIIAFWHGRQLMMAPLNRRSGTKKEVYTLISPHRDGKIISRAVGLLGIRTIAGSSNRGARQAALSIVRTIREGETVAITPDGPKGPCQKVKPGVARIAQMTGAQLFPFAYGATSKWKARSWDGMILPKPFSKGVCIVGDPITVPQDANEEVLAEYLTRIEDALNKVTDEVDNYVYP